MNPGPQNASSQGDKSTLQPAYKGAGEALSALKGEEFPADYIPCVFTQAELLFGSIDS